MRKSSLAILLVLVLSSSLGGCSSSFSRGLRAYHRGSYPIAVEHLVLAEETMRDAPRRTRVRYALYRGLTHLALGDKESSERWLAEAKALYDAEPSLLDPSDRGKLLSGWEVLGHPAGEWGAQELRNRGF